MTRDYEKFTFAITAIRPKYYNDIRDIMLNPPENRSYEILKLELIKSINNSQTETTQSSANLIYKYQKIIKYIHITSRYLSCFVIINIAKLNLAKLNLPESREMGSERAAAVFVYLSLNF